MTAAVFHPRCEYSTGTMVPSSQAPCGSLQSRGSLVCQCTDSRRQLFTECWDRAAVTRVPVRLRPSQIIPEPCQATQHTMHMPFGENKLERTEAVFSSCVPWAIRSSTNFYPLMCQLHIWHSLTACTPVYVWSCTLPFFLLAENSLFFFFLKILSRLFYLVLQ